MRQMPAQEQSRFCKEFSALLLAEDAVLIELVSNLKFPANREINREFFNLGHSVVILTPIQRDSSMA